MVIEEPYENKLIMQYEMGKEKEQTNEKQVKYPQIVSTAPCNDDWFEGQSHKRIASRIADIILDDSQHGIIGIDGGWGSGKSNLVGMTQKEIKERIADNKDSKYEFVTFDAWAHHTDYLRRSLLEEFVNELTVEKNLLSSKWNDSLDMVLARVKEVDMKQTVKLNEFVIGSGLLAILTPIISLFFDKPAFYYVMGAVFVLVIVGIFYSIISGVTKQGQKVNYANILADIKNLYVDAANILTRQNYSEVNNKNKQTKTREIITEKEPTARQFRGWMSQIDQELKSKNIHVVFVIDNMDRLPIAKVKETWATIHAFFAECKYGYIHTVIPFDRSHIINAFKEENIREVEPPKERTDEKPEHQTEVKSYGNDFINKTFYVVYRVSPPILSDWRDYFERIWKMAFGDELYKEHDELLLVFEKLSPDFTPRSIIAFINECVTLYSVMEEVIPSEYLGIYILGKERINKAPDKQLLTPDFLGSLKEKYANDEELPLYLSAIHYQIRKDKALDVVYLPKVKKALDEGNGAFIDEMGNDRVLNSLLSDAIPEAGNIENAIDFMEAISKKEKASTNYRLDFLWRTLFERIKSVGYKSPNYNRRHAIVLEHCRNKKGVISYFVGQYLEMGEGWVVADHVSGINRFRELAKQETDEYLEKHKTRAKEEVIEELLKLVKVDYDKYGLRMEATEFDKYLTQKNIGQFAEVDFLPYVFSEQCVLDKTWSHLVTLAKGSRDVEEHTILLKRMKEINKGKRLKDTLSENGAYSDQRIILLFANSRVEMSIYYDLLAMRIARGKNFSLNPSPTQDPYKTVWSKDEESLTKNVAGVLLDYTDYGSFMTSIKDFEQKQLVGAIARELTRNETSREKVIASKDQMLMFFDKIIEASALEPKELLEQIQQCDGVVEYKDFERWPISLFSACSGLDINLAKDINQHASAFLREVSTDKWGEQLIKPGFELNLWDVYKHPLLNLKDAAVNVLMKYAEDGELKPDKQRMKNVLEKYGNAKYKLKESFGEVHDVIVKNPNKEKVAYFTSWFFKYGIVSDENGVAVLYKTVYLDDSMVLEELVNVREKLNGIRLPDDFVEKMAQMAIGNRKGDEVFVAMCRNNVQIKAEMEEQLHPAGEDEKK